jgi:hypothetical protein
MGERNAMLSRFHQGVCILIAELFNYHGHRIVRFVLSSRTTSGNKAPSETALTLTGSRRGAYMFSQRGFGCELVHLYERTASK